MINDESVFRSLEIIENRIAEKLTVENIASAVYFSKYYYSRLFREIVGDSVMEYVTKRKLTLAGRELLETNDTVLDIALRFGYDSHEGFTRSFKAYMGVTPTDYRKYGLTAISRKTVKERGIMTYSKNTDEIIRELNELVKKAKETAEISRKHKNSDSEKLPFVKLFWNQMADKTDEYADKLKQVLIRITSIAERPDEITNRFNIIEAVESVAFITNVTALHVGVTVARNTPKRAEEDRPLCERYVELARAASLKAEKIARFFNELSALIFEDMRKTAAEKVKDAIQKGKALEEAIDGYEYIKSEIVNLVTELSERPPEEISVDRLDFLLFKLRIISFSIDTDILRVGGRNEALFAGLPAFEKSLREAADFFRTLIIPELKLKSERTSQKHFSDITFQVNVLLFYTRGEVSREKLGQLLNERQKEAFDLICRKIDGFIQAAHNAEDGTAYKELADRLYEIENDMTKEAETLNEYGNVIKFLANEYKCLADSLTKYIVMTEG